MGCDFILFHLKGRIYVAGGQQKDAVHPTTLNRGLNGLHRLHGFKIKTEA